MKKPKLIFYLIFGLFHLLTFLATLYLDTQSENLGFLFKIQKYIPLMKYWALVGLVLIIIDMVIASFSQRTHQRGLEALEKENNTLKAKMFDLQEAGRETKGPETLVEKPGESDT